MRSKLTLITAVKYNYPRYRNVNSFQRFSCIFAHDSITRQWCITSKRWTVP